jgi:hypothetical protein
VANPITVQFLVRGTQDVTRALRTIQQAAEAADKAKSQSAKREAQTRVQTDEQASKQRTRAEERGAREVERILRHQEKTSENVARGRVRTEEQAARQRARIEEQALRQRTRSEQQAARDSERIAKRLFEEQRRLQAQLAREAASGQKRSSNTQARLSVIDKAKGAAPHEQRAALVISHDMGREDSAARRRHERETKAAERAAQQRVRVEARADRETTREAEKSANERARISRQVDGEFRAMTARRGRENARILREGQRLEEASHRESLRRIQRETEEKQAQREKFARGVGALGRTAANAAVGGVSRAAGLAKNTLGMVTQLGGGFSIADSVERAAKNSGQLEDILNSAQNPGSKITANNRRREASEVEGDIQGTATRFGLERSNVQEGLQDITGITGDLETGMKLLPQLAELARATGTKFSDMANAAGNVGLAFDDITDSGVKADKIMGVMRTLGGQGKAGNVEIRDQAVQAGKIIASSGQFAGDNAENIEKLGAMMQFSRGGGGAWNASSASTAITAFTGTFGKSARLDAFESKGVDIFADKGKTRIRPPEQIIADALDKTGGSQPEMAKMFGSAQSLRAVNRLTRTYTEAEAKEKGSGRKAVLADFKTMTKGVAMSKADVTEAAGRRTQALDVRMASAREQFDEAVQKRLVPALLQLVPVIEQLIPVFVDLNAQAMPAFVDLIKTVADFANNNKELIRDIAAHPVGALIAAEITKSMGTVAMGALFEKLLSSKLGTAGVVVGSAVMAIKLGMMTIDETFKKDTDAAGKAVNDQIEATRLAKKIEQGTATPDEMAKAGTLMANLKGDVEKQRDLRDNPDIVKKLAGGAASVFTPEAAKEAAAAEAKNQNDTIKNLQDSMAKLAAAIDKNTRSKGADGTGGGAPGGTPPAAGSGIVQRVGAQ